MAAGVKHDYHLVDPSAWPIVGSVGVFCMAAGGILWMNSGYEGFFGLQGHPWIFLVGLALVAYTMTGWWRDVVKESTEQGHHTPVVKLGLRYGMILFIASEVMFFVAWFWAYFNSALFPHDVGLNAWPPAGIVPFDPWHLPLANTVILLTSGATVTWAHHAILNGDRKSAIQGLLLTVLLGMSFTCVQAYEYMHAGFVFGINPELANAEGVDLSAIYGSTFFMVTGFHGFHVIVGTIFLTVCLFRAIKGHFTPTRHFGFEAAAWYWHFVDVVWLFLFACIYVWGTQGGALAPHH